MTQATKFRSLSISLPENMVEKVDAIAKKHYKTRSDIIREAIMVRIIPAYTATKSEEKAIKKAKEEYARGEFISWTDLKHELDNPSVASRQ